MGFSIPFAQLAEKAKLDVDTVVRKATFELFGAVVLKTPVDTGRLRANWNVSPNVIDPSTTGSTNAARASAEVQKALEIPAGGVVYMSNGLPYARIVEYGLYPNPPKNPGGKTVAGYSTQAPAGMVRVTEIEFEQYVQEAIRK